VVYVVRVGEIKNAYKILVGKSGGKRKLERCRRRRDQLPQDKAQLRALVNTVMNLHVP